MDELKKSWDDKAYGIFLKKRDELESFNWNGAWQDYLKEIGAKRRRVNGIFIFLIGINSLMEMQSTILSRPSHYTHSAIQKANKFTRIWCGLFGELSLIDPLDCNYYISVKRDLAVKILTLGLP